MAIKPNKGISPEKFLETVFEDMSDSFKNVLSEMGSPIEKSLCGALLTEAVLNFETVILQGNDDGLYFGVHGPSILRIMPQHKIGKYRVDFYLEYSEYFPENLVKLIVECDGHDFHEKTKSQAQGDKKRDRTLQMIAPVFRFTGSEIWRDAHVCANQVIEFLLSAPKINLKKQQG